MPDNCYEHGCELRGSTCCATLPPVLPMTRPVRPRPAALPTALISAMLAIALLASACSGDGIGAGERSVGEGGAQAADAIPGRTVDGFAPGVEDRVAVIGISDGESLEMRAFPGSDQPIVAQIPSNADDLFGFGLAHESPDGSLWWQIRYADAQGWIQPGAAYLGASTDASAIVAGTLSNSTYGSVEELVTEAAERYDDAVIVDAGSPNDAGEIQAIIDSITTSSEFQRGERLQLTITPSAGNHRLISAEIVPLCARGLADDRSCA